MNAAKDPGLTEGETDIFSIIERATSVFSFLGSLFVIGSFCLSKAFHKPINRLVFYATFGNLMTNVATLMATSFIGDITSAGCKFQAFLIQMYDLDPESSPSVTDPYLSGSCLPTPTGHWPWP